MASKETYVTRVQHADKVRHTLVNWLDPKEQDEYRDWLRVNWRPTNPTLDMLAALDVALALVRNPYAPANMRDYVMSNL